MTPQTHTPAPLAASVGTAHQPDGSVLWTLRVGGSVVAQGRAPTPAEGRALAHVALQLLAIGGTR
jgi:hypothetical protein